MKCSTSKASAVAAWSFSSSLTSPRQKSDESTSVGLKCSRANVLLPEPGGADQHDEGELGNGDFHASSQVTRENTAICVGEPSCRVVRADAGTS